MMGYGQGMMGYGRHMLDQRLTHDLFLDRVDALGLTPEQVTKLRAIRTECRKDVIHAAAEARIARLNLEDLLNNDRWTPKEAEKLVRQQYKLQGDIELRYLQAVYSARQELTAEQLEKVHP